MALRGEEEGSRRVAERTRRQEVKENEGLE